MNKLKQIVIIFSIFTLGLTQVSQALTLQEIINGQQGQVLGAATLALDPSTPAAVKSNSQTLTTASFTPPAGSVLYVLVGINSNSSNKINSVSGGGLTFAKVTSYGTEMGNDAVAYLYTAVVGSSQSMTISAVQQQSTSSGTYAFLKVLVVTGANTSSPVGAVGGARGITGTINNTYTSTSDNSWGWMLTADWAQKGIPTVGSGQTLYDSYNVSLQDTYAIVQRSAPTATAGTSVTLNTTAPTSGAQISQLYFEMMPAQAGTNPPPTDTTAPTTPTNLSASAVSSSSINLSWSASTDAVGVTGYKIYRNGSLLATSNSTLTTYFDTGLSASTSYSYTVAAYDAAGNTSSQSSSANATTQTAGSGGGGNWYVRSGAGGNGTSWASAWSDVTGIIWSSIQPGDTIWIAGGSYGALSVGKSGNADTNAGRIFIKRATAGVHGSDTGWSTGYDAQVSLSSIYWASLNVGSYVTIDGQVDSGIKVVHGNSDSSSSVSFDRGVSYVTLRYLDLQGPGDVNGFHHLGDDRGIDVTAWNGSSYDAVNYLKVQYSRIHGACTQIWNMNASNGIWEYNQIYNSTDSSGVPCHPNIFVSAGSNNVTIRYNKIYNYDAEGIMILNGNHGSMYVYGNLWYSGQTYARILESQNGVNGPVYFYNNTIDNMWGGVLISNGGTWASGSEGKNNIWINMGGGGMPTESNNLTGSVSGIFANYSAKDYHLISSASSAINKGTSLTSDGYINKDMDGNTRGADGTWDIGAFEYTGSVAPPTDTTAPTVPTGLSASAVSSSAINLSWSASTDAVGVTGYKIYRNGSLLATSNSTATTYSDTGLSASTSYSYTVAAYDAAGNNSSQSSSASATTQAGTPPTSGGSVVTAASCSKADVQTSINSTKNGDTVNVPGGNCTWTAGVSIANKSISLIGGFGGTTTISLTGGNFVHLTRSAGGQNASRISTFTINQTSTSQTFLIDSDGGWSPQGFRIDHITRNVTGDNFIEFAGGWGNAATSWEGLIDSNVITNGRIVYYGEELSTAGRYRWSEPLNLGDEHALYIEDNTFIITSPSRTNYINQIDGGEGARTVARFNTFVGGRIESHGIQTENSRAAKRWEFYYNTFTSSQSDKQYRPFLIRGGTGVVFHNTTDGNYSVNSINIDNLRSHQSDVYSSMTKWGKCDGTSPVDGNISGGEGYACRDQIGASTDAFLWDYSLTNVPTQAKVPAYFWGNTQNSSRLPVELNCVGTTAECTGQSTKQLLENRDWFQTPAGTFNGTAGVGEGILANRPATCTAGVGYWATDQGQWNQKSAIKGVLYRCMSQNTWAVYYTPYTYPHPLVSGASTPPPTDTTAPTVPTNLSATGISVSSISLSWTASSDAVGVTGYRIYRAGTQIGTSATNSYTDTGLSVGTSYSYTVSAYDAAGNTSAQTSSVSGTTLSNPDTTAPTVSILNPSSGSFTGNITFSATASDPSVAGQTLSGLKTLTLYIDGSIYATSSSGSISKTLDTTTLTNASHTLTAQATDNAGNNSTIASVTITVNNAPATKYPRTITLTSLEGLSAIPNNQSITVTILSGSTVLETQNLTPNASKQYTVTFLSSDPQLVDIRVKVNNYLSAKLSAIDTTQNTASVSSIPQLLAGDINNDNTINSLDYSSLNSNWLKTTSTGDMNNDGIVNSFDFAILKNNYNKVGQ